MRCLKAKREKDGGRSGRNYESSKRVYLLFIRKCFLIINKENNMATTTYKATHDFGRARA